MSRLYEALSRATSGDRQPTIVPRDLPGALPVELKKTAVWSNVRAQSNEPERSPETDELYDSECVSLDSGHVPSGSRLIAWTNSNSLVAEKFRALATRLAHIREQRELRSLQITSSVVNEGKSFVAANLAVTLAKYSGGKTLLVEGDLHRPRQSSVFGLSELEGISQWWTGEERSLAPFLRRFSELPLWFLGAGQVREQPSEILMSLRFAEAFTKLTACFDWIVVDSTPMLPIVDVNLWSRLVSGTLLVIREGVTPIKHLTKGLESLDNPRLIGVVVNDASGFDQRSYEKQYGAPTRMDKMR